MGKSPVKGNESCQILFIGELREHTVRLVKNAPWGHIILGNGQFRK